MTDRTPSEEQWLGVAAFLIQNRHDLAVRAADGYPPELRVAGTPLLAPPAWLLPAPVPLHSVRLEFRPRQPPPDAPDLAALAPYALPERADGTRYGRYTDVVAALAPPAVFENRPVYRLIEADLAGAGGEGPRLVFGRGRYFDGIDAGGAAGHEYAAARLGRTRGCPYRAALGGPAGLARRSAPVATSALTLRHDKSAGTATFPLHYREPGKVSHAGGLYQVLPVGVFQPSGEAPWNEANDFSLWRGLLREYAEELLGADEDHGSEQAPVDYENWPLARAMTDGLADGSVRAWCLGLGADPLTFALDLLTVVVIDAPRYDGLFGDMVEDNAEGRVIRPRPFDEPSVAGLLASAPLQAAAAALLTLALAHRETLLPLPAALAPPVPDDSSDAAKATFHSAGRVAPGWQQRAGWRPRVRRRRRHRRLVRQAGRAQRGERGLPGQRLDECHAGLAFGIDPHRVGRSSEGALFETVGLSGPDEVVNGTREDSRHARLQLFMLHLLSRKISKSNLGASCSTCALTGNVLLCVTYVACAGTFGIVCGKSVHDDYAANHSYS